MSAEQLPEIAQEHLGICTLKPRGLDRLDFHDLAVWQIRAALEAAYAAGQRAKLTGSTT